MKIHEIREVPRYLRQRARMPVARFELVSSLDDGLVSVALDDVVLLDPEDTMEEVKDRAAQLARFNELWVLSQQGRGKEGFLFDHAQVRMGLIVLTQKGRELFGVPEPGSIPF